MRYLGRGGIPHPFSGVGAGPRFLDFLPDVPGLPSNRFVVASGQSGAGLQILQPFQESVDANPNTFIVPALGRGETITSMNVSNERLGLGTSAGNVVQYQLAGLEGSQKRVLELPSFTPPPPAMSIDPMLLSTPDPTKRRGANNAIKSIFSAYLLVREPTVSSLRNPATFGRLISAPLVGGGKLNVSPFLLQLATDSVDFLQTIPTAKLEVDLMEDFRERKSDRSRRKSDRSRREPKPNANKLLRTPKLYRMERA